MNLVQSKELAYWVGVAQSDGYNKKKTYFGVSQSRKKYYNKIILKVGEKSKPMLLKFQKISNQIFKRNAKCHKEKNQVFSFHIGIKSFIHEFSLLNISFKDPPEPPNWCLKNKKYLGAYLAGIIDGDGNINITRPKYPQCKIRISGGYPQINLKETIIKKLNCHAWITKSNNIKSPNDYRLEFKFSPKNKEFILKNIIPWLQIPHKKTKLKKYSRLRKWSGKRESNSRLGISAN
jgi:hypothetical protein